MSTTDGSGTATTELSTYWTGTITHVRWNWMTPDRIRKQLIPVVGDVHHRDGKPTSSKPRYCGRIYRSSSGKSVWEG